MERIKVNEIFKSIQGESSFAGKVCVFVRVAGCNLRCAYCDTKYAYEEGKFLKIEEILKKIKKFKCNLVSITGGEPLLEKGVYKLMEKLIKSGKQVLLETNGSVSIKDVDKKTVIVMDIKCPSSREDKKFLQENLKYLKPSDEIKFVIGSRKDYLWAKKAIKTFGISKHTILFSPAFENLKPAVLAEWIIKDNLDVRFNLQLHKCIWNSSRRGV